jgi:predicted permease
LEHDRLMSPRTVQFIAFLVFNLAALVAGYIARERGWVREERSRTLHFWTVVALWSLVGLLGVWKLPPKMSNLWLVALEPILVAVPALLAIPVGHWIGAERKQIGVLAIAAGLGNLGFTLGGYLCYMLLTDPALLAPAEASPEEVGDAALAYAIAQVSMMSVAGIVFLYPIARHFGGERAEDESIARLIYHSLVDWRAMMLYTALVGAVLAYMHVPFPEPIDDWGVMSVLFYLGGFTAYFGIGLRLHAGETVRAVRFHAALAGIKFLALPLLTGALLLAAGWTAPGPPALLEAVMLVLAVMPTAIQTVIVPNLFHLDARLASGMWLVNTALFAVIPLPVLLYWLS